MSAVLPLVLKTNAAQLSVVTINDLNGIEFDAAGANPETFDEVEEIKKLQGSEQLRALLTDDAFTGSSTMVLNDGTSDIPQGDALAFLDAALLRFDNTAYAVVKRNDAGQIDADLDFDGTAEVGGLKLKNAADANSQQINNLAPGVAPADAVNKAQLDAVANGLNPKQSVIVLADSDEALSGLPTIDGVGPLTAGQRVLLTAQTTPSQNGIWEVQVGAWTRPSDFATGSDAASAYVPVQQGNTYADQIWLCISDSPTIVDTDPQTWQFYPMGSNETRKEVTFGVSRRVPGPAGILALENPGGVPTSQTEKRMIRAGVITGAGVQVNAVDASRSYNLSVRINGAEQATVPLATSTIGNQVVGLSVNYNAGDLLSVFMVRQSGSGRSTFRDITAAVELQETI